MPYILVIDNTKNLKKAFMTPKLIKCLDDSNVEYKILSDRKDLYEILNSEEEISNILGVILSGGPLCLSEALTIDSINKNIAVLTQLSNTPILGICFGFQVIVACYGGKIISMNREDTGNVVIYTKKKSKLFKKIVLVTSTTFEGAGTFSRVGPFLVELFHLKNMFFRCFTMSRTKKISSLFRRKKSEK